jgi:protein gp37
MGENSKIEWTHHTFNPWTGCTRVSPACDHCYAANIAKRNPAAFGSWEPGSPRKRTSPRNWHQPIIWNRKAAEAGERHRVFCASMADVFDNQVSEDWRVHLWALIEDTPQLDWLLLTKRPQNIQRMLPQPGR